MSNLRVQWLTQDPSLWEVDWLRFLFKPTQDYIDVEFEANKIKTDKNTILICSHAVPYRTVLDSLRQNGKKYTVFFLSDENLIDPCEWLHDPHCVRLLRNYVHPNQIRHPKVTTIGLGYKINFAKSLKQCNDDRPTLWSFAGTCHGERGKTIELFKSLSEGEVYFCSGFNAADGLSTENYAAMLQRSKYALCPPGQDSMDSFRIYEALEAGCVPVCLKNTGYWHLIPSYWHGVFTSEHDMPFVCENTWEECLAKIEKIEASGEYENIKKQCKQFWSKWKNQWQKVVTQTGLVTKIGG